MTLYSGMNTMVKTSAEDSRSFGLNHAHCRGLCRLQSIFIVMDMVTKEAGRGLPRQIYKPLLYADDIILMATTRVRTVKVKV